VPPNATIEALPKSYPGIAGLSAELRVPGALDIDPNGGFVIMDLSHYAETFLVNGDSRAAAAPLVAMAPPKHYAQHGHLSSERWSTTQDELDYTAAQGWTWTASQVPTWPHQPDYTIQAVDVDLHSESESDDCWQNIMMWLRSGTRGFWDRARGWCDYQRDEMTRRTEGWSFAWDADGEGPTRVARPTIEIPLTAADQAYLGASSYGRVGYFPRINTSHFWGWGLVDWALLTGDPEAVPAAVDLAEINRRHFGWRTDGLGQRGRTGARALMHAVRVFEATGAEEWRQYMEHLATNYTERDPSWLEWAGHYTVPLPDLGPEWRGMNPHHFANLDQAFERYVAAGGARAQEIKRRLVRMGDFALEWALHPLWLHSSSTIAVTPDGRQWVSSMDENPPAVAQINPYHTLTWVDTLVRAYRLSGDRKFLAHAAFMHERATRHRYGQQVLSAPFVMPPKVGRFLNNGQQIGRIYYPDHGHLQFAHLLFADALAAGVPIRPRPVFTASAATVPFDGSVTLSWAADGGATACQGGYGWNGPLPASGTRTLAGLKTNRGYVLTCREPLQSLVVPVKVGPAPASEPGLALRWSFNTGDIDSTLPDQVSLIDRSGNGRNGSVEDATLIPGRMGQALSFAGYTSGLTGPYGRSDLAMALPPAVSFAAWLRFGATQTSEAVALAYGRFGYPRAMNWQLSGSALQVKIRFDGPATASLDVPGLGDGHWHHVAVVFSPTQTVLYVDGRARGSLPNGPVAWYADELYLATDKALKRFAKVDLDEVRVLLRTLTAAEVAALAQSPTP
jgi:hypothetical protein